MDKSTAKDLEVLREMRVAKDGTLMGVYIFRAGRRGPEYRINNQPAVFTTKEKALAYRRSHKQELEGSFIQCGNLCQDFVCAKVDVDP